jgi:hypothetical protein
MPTYDLISTLTSTGSSTVLSFTSIPATYTDLRLSIRPSASGLSTSKITINNVTSADYSYINLNAGRSGFGDSRAAGDTKLTLQAGSASYTLNNPDVNTFYMDFIRYADTTVFKTIITYLGYDRGDGGQVGQFVCMWNFTTAINRIDFILDSNTLNSATTATLYGIKKA